MSLGQPLLRAGVQILSQSQEIPETLQIKEEPEEPSVKQEEEQLPVTVPDVIDVVVKSEEQFSSEGQTEDSSDTDNDDDWETYSCSTAKSTGLFPKTKSVRETSMSVEEKHQSEDEGFEGQRRQKKRHQCTICKNRFLYKQGLQRHMTVHTGEKPYSCSICEKTFSQKGNLQKHQQTHSENRGHGRAEVRKHECSICHKRFWTNHNLNLHFKVHTEKKPYSCSFCDKAYAHKVQLDKHLAKHRVYDSKIDMSEKTCSFCQKVYMTKQSLRAHIRIHTGDTPYSCSICNKAYVYESQLIIHMRAHTGVYSCLTCEAIFPNRATLKVHMRTHKREKPFSCSLCSKTFMFQMSRDRHMESHTRDKPYSCLFCSRVFTRKDHLDSHIKTHRGNITFNGFTCQMNFTETSQQEHLKTQAAEKTSVCSPSSLTERLAMESEEDLCGLQTHATVHTGKKPYSCSVCEKTFSQKGNFQQHMRIHSAESGPGRTEVKKHECSICQKRFRTKQHLNVHLRVHSEEKPYNDSTHDETFAQKDQLDKHLVKHAVYDSKTDVSDTTCSFCQKTFLNKQGLRAHTRVHAGDTPYSCSICNKTYVYESQLIIHMSSHTSQPAVQPVRLIMPRLNST